MPLFEYETSDIWFVYHALSSSTSANVLSNSPQIRKTSVFSENDKIFCQHTRGLKNAIFKGTEVNLQCMKILDNNILSIWFIHHMDIFCSLTETDLL